jgi:hypothetical protein
VISAAPVGSGTALRFSDLAGTGTKVSEVVNLAEFFAPDVERYIGAGVDGHQLGFVCVY